MKKSTNSNRFLMLLTNPFLPDPRPLKEAKILIKYGYTVDVIAWDRDSTADYPQKENISGIHVKRICKFGGYGKGLSSLLDRKSVV